MANTVFSEQAASLMIEAQAVAREIGGNLIGTEHLMLAMAGVTDGPTEFVLSGAGISYDDLKRKVEQYFGSSRKWMKPRALSPRTRRVVGRARELAEGMPIEHFHLLMAFNGEPEAPARLILRELGLRSDDFEREVMAAIAKEREVQDFLVSLNSSDL